MHVALLANTAWLDDELTAFQQLTVGLVDEQVKVSRVVPSWLVDRATDQNNDSANTWGSQRTPRVAGGGLSDSPLFGQRLTWNESRFAPVNHRRLVKLSENLDASGVSVIHALHGELWQPAAVIAEQLDIPVVLSVSSWNDVNQAAKLLRQINPTRCVFTATTQPLAAEMRQRTENLVLVETIPPGVHVSSASISPRHPGESLCVAVCGDGMMDPAYGMFLDALTQVLRDQPHIQCFFDGQQTDQRQLWRAARRVGLLSNVSFVPRRLGHREMLLMADALIHPQCGEASRGVTLQAMAHAMPVLAVADPWLDYLIPGHTAWTLDSPDAQAWADLLRRLIAEPDAAADLGMRARAWIHDERLACDHIERTLALYRSITGQPIAFPG